jgi:amino acid adenylation domain-containing protein
LVDRESTASAGAAPRTATEERLAAIWREVLRVETIGADDDFFVLGGHSLLATQVVSRLRGAFGIDLPLRMLFTSPALGALAARIDEAVAGRGGETGESRPVPPPLVPRTHADPLPLSFAQERLWLLDQLTPGSVAYNIPAVIRLGGDLNLRALVQSLHAIVDRHAILRTAFGIAEGLPVQMIAARWRPRVPWVDLGDLPAMRRETELRRLGGEESARPFDLARGPLLRAVLLRLLPREHVILLTLHQIVSDCWSTGILVREMAALYKTFSTGAPAPLPDLPVQYADYALWQRQWLVGEALAAQVGYWQEQLGGAPEVLALPTDRTRPAVQSLRRAYVLGLLSGELAREVAQLSQRRGATPFMVLLATFFALLWRLTGQDDMIVGTPVANRTRQETEGLIGLFVNTLPLRVEARGALDFLALLRRVRKVALDAYARQDLPFEKVIEEVQPQRGLAHATFVQVMFTFHDAPVDEITLPGLALVPVESGTGHAQLDLELSLRETRQGQLVRLEYSSDLFDATTARRLIGAFEGLLSSAVRQPQQTLRELPVLSRAQRHQVLVEWSDTSRMYGGGRQSLSGLIAEQVRRSPESTAVVFEGESLSYGELNARANRLGRYLRGLGVGAEVLVAVCMERSLELSVALLAVLKAGGAYVPLDPGYPGERLAYMLADSGAAVLLTQECLRGLLAATCPVVCVDVWSGEGESGADLEAGDGGEGLAYVIYTSGSTGRPKGVEISHGALTNFLISMAERPGLGPEDTLLAVTSLSFDIAGLELYLPLVVGGTVVLASREEAADGRRLRELIAAGGVKALQATPTTWQLLLEAGWAGGEGLKALCGGEALPPSLAASLLERVGSLWNVYGPTETTVWSTVEEIRGAGSILIGRPIANTEAYVVDVADQPVPTGVAGELLLGGAGLARGYLGRPELTAERFVPNPFGASGSRLYRTGDLARYRVDGRLECLGRIDHQVKVRGFRIELGEIEAALERHPVVAAAVVTAGGGRPVDVQLTAWVVCHPGCAVKSRELRDFLTQSLPGYMVPARFVLRDRLPLTANGKIDRTALQG